MLKNKYFYIILVSLFFLILLFVPNSSFAAFKVQSNNDDTTFYNLPDLPEKSANAKATVIVKKVINDVDYFYLYYLDNSISDVVFTVYLTDFTSSFGYSYYDLYFHNINQSSDTYIYSYRCTLNNPEWKVVEAGQTRYRVPSSLGHTFYSGDTSKNYIDDFLYSDKDICVSKGSKVGVNWYYPPEEGNVFFQAPPSWGITLVKARKLEEILPMVNKLATMIVPIGLKVFSVLLVIYLLASKKWRRT